MIKKSNYLFLMIFTSLAVACPGKQPDRFSVTVSPPNPLVEPQLQKNNIPLIPIGTIYGKDQSWKSTIEWRP